MIENQIVLNDTIFEKDFILKPKYHFCYNKIINDSWEIVVNDIDGNVLKNISHSNSGSFSPQWSPDGRNIVFRRDKSVGGSDIYSYSILNDTSYNLTNDLAANISADIPRWTPDGKKIIFDLHESGYQAKTYIMNSDGSQKRMLLNSTIVKLFFFNDCFHFLYVKNDTCNQVYKSNLDLDFNKIILDLDTIGIYKNYLDDFDPISEKILCHEDSGGFSFQYSFQLISYDLNLSLPDTLCLSDSNWIFIRPIYSNDYSKIAFIKTDYETSDSKLNILIDKIRYSLFSLPSDYQFFDYHPLSFSPYDSFLAFGVNAVQNSNTVYWISFLKIIMLSSEDIVFSDEGNNLKWNPIVNK